MQSKFKRMGARMMRVVFSEGFALFVLGVLFGMALFVVTAQAAEPAAGWHEGRLEDLNQVLIWQQRGRAEVDGLTLPRRAEDPAVEYRWRCVDPVREPCVLPADVARAEAAI